MPFGMVSAPTIGPPLLQPTCRRMCCRRCRPPAAPPPGLPTAPLPSARAPPPPQQPQIILLKEGTDTSQGKPQLISNINACYAVADVVRTTLGPRGMDKLMHTERAVTVSNDGATIMKTLDIVHPAAKALVDISLAQDAEVGAGAGCRPRPGAGRGSRLLGACCGLGQTEGMPVVAAAVGARTGRQAVLRRSRAGNSAAWPRHAERNAHALQALCRRAPRRALQVGDGTTTVVLLAAEFLKECKAFVEEGVHPQASRGGVGAPRLRTSGLQRLPAPGSPA